MHCDITLQNDTMCNVNFTDSM